MSVYVSLYVFPSSTDKKRSHNKASLTHARRVLPLLPRTKMRGHSTLWDSAAGVSFQCACWQLVPMQ
jgi:hypothetical protein